VQEADLVPPDRWVAPVGFSLLKEAKEPLALVLLVSSMMGRRHGVPSRVMATHPSHAAVTLSGADGVIIDISGFGWLGNSL